MLSTAVSDTGYRNKWSTRRNYWPDSLILHLLNIVLAICLLCRDKMPKGWLFLFARFYDRRTLLILYRMFLRRAVKNIENIVLFAGGTSVKSALCSRSCESKSCNSSATRVLSFGTPFAICIAKKRHIKKRDTDIRKFPSFHNPNALFEFVMGAVFLRLLDPGRRMRSSTQSLCTANVKHR